MSPTNDTTTLVCLFHHDDHAHAALKDLYSAGVEQTSITSINGKDDNNAVVTTLESLGVPDRDVKHLQSGISSGGTVIVVAAVSNLVDTIERIFGEHRATKIDEAVRDIGETPLVVDPPVEGQRAIPIVEEELEVGKRTVDRGGVRVYRRVIEMPAEASVNLREEHVVVDRRTVDRPATQADLDAQGSKPIELVETTEEAVVGKSAHVVEEVLIGKVSGEHIQHIHDTVRHTEVEVAELAVTDLPTDSKKSL